MLRAVLQRYFSANQIYYQTTKRNSLGFGNKITLKIRYKRRLNMTKKVLRNPVQAHFPQIINGFS